MSYTPDTWADLDPTKVVSAARMTKLGGQYAAAMADAAALYGEDVRPWAATTVYAAGQAVVSPSGDVVTAKTAHTSGSTFSGTGTSGNWNLSTTFVAASDSFVSVRLYGAKGDGVTDDAPAIRAAETALAGTGRTLYFPATAGGYRIASSIVKTTNTSWVGDGTGYSQGSATSRSTRIIVDGPTTGYALTINTVSNVGIRGIEFGTANASADTVAGIYINGAAVGVSRISECAFFNFLTGVKVGTTGNWIVDNWFQSCGICIDVSGSENIIRGNQGYGDTNGTCALLVRSSANMVMSNKFYGDGATTNYGVTVWGFGNTITANVFDSFLEAAIVLEGHNTGTFSAGNPACDANVIVGNNLSSCGNLGNVAGQAAAGTYNTAILLHALNSDVTNTVITGNTIFNKRTDRATQAGIYALAESGHQVSGVKANPNAITNVVTGIRTSGAVSGVDQGPATTLLASGESTLNADLARDNVSIGTQRLYLTYFTAVTTETCTQVALSSGSTAAGATPTLVQIGIYSVDASDNLTLITSTPNDTTLFAAANTRYVKALSSSFVKQAGQRYAVGLLLVTAAASPAVYGVGPFGGSGNMINTLPRKTGYVLSQTSLPATVTAASVTNNGNRLYAEVTP